jgi:hypothetical protein
MLSLLPRLLAWLVDRGLLDGVLLDLRLRVDYKQGHHLIVVKTNVLAALLCYVGVKSWLALTAISSLRNGIRAPQKHGNHNQLSPLRVARRVVGVVAAVYAASPPLFF